MSLEYRKLSGDEITEGLDGLKGWEVEGDRIAKTFAFEQYSEGLAFVNQVADLAQGLDHHPDIELCYGKVRVSMNTHSVEGLSPYDIELAKRIETLGATGK